MKHFDHPGPSRMGLRATVLWLLVSGLPFVAATRSAGGTGDIVAVYSSVSPAYARTTLPDGSFQVETYAFGEGGYAPGAMNDPTIERMHFADIVQIIAPALAGKKYYPSKDQAHTDLLIMVYWGSTIGTDHAGSSAGYQIAQSLLPPPMPPPPPPPTGRPVPGAESVAQQAAAIKAANDSATAAADSMLSLANHQRDRQDYENAATLGYANELQRVQDYQSTALRGLRQDIVDDVEESRYYVVLLAYDFQTLVKTKQRKMLWQTRFSIREQGNDFSEELDAMVQQASRYFGQDSQGLLRKPLPETRVKLGDLKVLEYEPETKK